jgi:hypothetical protein
MNDQLVLLVVLSASMAVILHDVIMRSERKSTMNNINVIFSVHITEDLLDE